MSCSDIIKTFFSRFSAKLLLPALVAAPLFFNSPAMAATQEIQSGDHDPLIADGEGNNYTLSYVTTGGASNTITTGQNDINSIIPGGNSPTADNKTLQYLDSQGKIITNSPALYKERLATGTKTYSLKVRDTITGDFITISTYSSDNIAQDDYGYQMSVPVYKNVNGMQYIGLKLGEVNSGGGALTIKLGGDTAAHNSDANTAHLAAKQSTLFKADGTAGNSSILRWENNNRFIFDAVYVDPSDSADKRITNIVQYNSKRDRHSRQSLFIHHKQRWRSGGLQYLA